MPSRLTRQTASSFTQRVSQKSAVARCWRSGEAKGSLGSSTCFPFVRCSTVNVVTQVFPPPPLLNTVFPVAITPLFALIP